eukprot:gene19226-25077_t
MKEIRRKEFAAMQFIVIIVIQRIKNVQIAIKRLD